MSVKPDLHLMLVDGKVVHVDMGPMIERHRRAHIEARAAAIDPAADLAGDQAFTADEVRDMWRASGLSGDDLDAAANVALALAEVERYGWLSED